MSDERAHQTRVFKFRCLADLPEEAVKELRRAHELSNLMIELEKEHGERVAAEWRRHPELLELEQQIEAATEAIEAVVAEMKSHKQKTRSTKPDPEIKAKLTAARKHRKECKEKFKAKKELLYPVIKEQLVKLSDQLRGEMKATYQRSIDEGLYWANYNAVRDRHQAAVKAVRATRRMGKPADLKFRRWTGEGTLVVQLQRQSNQPPRTPEMIADGEEGIWRNVVQLTPAHDPDEWDKLTRAEQRKVRVGVLRFRIGSKASKATVDAEITRRLEELDHDPTEDEAKAVKDEVTAELDHSGYIELPVIVHRPIPLDADIAMMEISRRRLGSRMLVHVSVVVRLPLTPAKVEGKQVALHVGWRGLEDGSIRVGVLGGVWKPPEELASVVRYHGTWSEIVIPAAWRNQMEYVQGVASIRGRNLDGLKKWVLEWLGEHPDHAIAGIDTIDKWRSPSRFAALSLRIRGDDSVDHDFRRQLEAWRKQDRHLWDLESNLRAKILARRNDAFAKVANWCLDDAALVRTDTFNLTPLMRKPDIGAEDTEAHRRARANRVMAAPGILRGILLDAANRRGVHVDTVDGAIAAVHYLCGTELDMTEREAKLMVWCSHCEKSVDQDANTLEMLRTYGGITPSVDASVGA